MCAVLGARRDGCQCRNWGTATALAGATAAPAARRGFFLGLLVVEAGLEHAPGAVKVGVCRYDGGVKGCQVRRVWRAGGACSSQRCDRPSVAAQVKGGALVCAVRPREADEAVERQPAGRGRRGLFPATCAP
jgi:hypothetical protein